MGDKFKKPFQGSLNLLAKHQTELGLIPNCVGSYNIERRSNVTFNSIDAPLWYIIGHYVYAKAYEDITLLKKHRHSILKALTWLRYQDPNNDSLIVQQPTGDWMDAFPHKYGRVIGTQALHYAALRLVGDYELANYIKRIVNGETQAYLSPYDKKRGYYLPWVWKDHDGDREQEEYFDTFGNLIAIVTGLATDKIAHSILKHIEKAHINKPFPCKALWPPIERGSKNWHSYFSKCDARMPYSYLNGGVWPFTGPLRRRLVKVKKFEKAEIELENLARANIQVMPIRELSGKYGFNEWLHGKTGKPKGEPYQGWSAGMYIYAYECVKRKQVLFFM